MIFDEIDTGFKWYDSLSKQNRYKEYCAQLCDYALMSPCNDLLPFQIKTDSFSNPTSWTLVHIGDPIIITPVPATHTICIQAEAVSFGISIDGYGSVATSVWLGSASLTIANLVADINSGGTFTAYQYGSSGQCMYIIAPLGELWNGVDVTFGINHGAFSSLSTGEFSGASDSTIGDSIDITTCIRFINLYDIDGFTYVQYNGGDLSGCMSQQMECGKWYSVLSDGENFVYSEIFEVLPIEDLQFEQSKLPLFTAWRWYDSKEKQTRYKEYCQQICDQYVLSSNLNLLPFQIKAPNGTTGIQSWKLVSIDEDCEYLLDTTLVDIVSTSDGDRLIYYGDDTDLPCGKFYSVLDDGVTVWYSELIETTSAISDVEDSFYLLQETGSKILQETFDGILLE